MVVYLLSRCDLKSMTHGKELAQAQHCGVQMMSKYSHHKDVKEYIKQGLEQHADHFNTTITLEVASKACLGDIVYAAKKLNFVADLLIDPTYPFWVEREIADAYNMPWSAFEDEGTKVLATRSEITFGWLLGDKNDDTFRNLVDGLELKSHNKLIYDEKK